MNVRQATPADFPRILAIVNAAAEAYRGVIPADRWHEPYMGAQELEAEIAEACGSGSPTNAAWAIRFYRKNGFALVDRDEKDRLLRKYWSIPPRQVETSVVLADERWRTS